PDKQFTAEFTLPKLKQHFPDSKLLLLFGSDFFHHMPTWPRLEYLLDNMGFVVAVKGTDDMAESLYNATHLVKKPQELHLVESLEPAMSSRKVRDKLRAGKPSPEILASVADYANKHWLYVSVSIA